MSESDFAESIRILRQHCVRFLVIGGYAMAHHGLVRATNDVDVLVATDETNVARIRAWLQSDLEAGMRYCSAWQRLSGMIC